jgi:DNA polymerase-1
MKFANCHDTLLAHHAFASHLPQRLDHVASCYTDSRPWKRIFKGGGEDEKGTTPDKLSGDELCKYNASDAQLTMLSWLRMQGDLEPERAVYEHDRQLAAVCREMIRTGIGVDEGRKNELSEALGVRRLELQEQLRNLVSDPEFMPGKLDHVRHHLFSPSSLGARYVLVTPKGQASTANETLEGLRLGGNERHAAFASALLTWRLAGKVKSTYLDAVGGVGDKSIHVKAGRAHYNWKPFGTVSGRLSCRFQSVPKYKKSAPEHRVREIYVPRAGHTFVYYDVSQAEMRLAAYLSNDPVFIEACRGDVHVNNAKAVFPQATHLLTDKLKNIPKTEGGGKDYRDIAKNLGFAISYCAEAEKVYVTLRRKGFDVSMSAVSLILDKLHSAYRVYYRWVEANLSAVRQLGYMRTPFLGRIRWLGWYPKITDVANYPIQSGLADIVNRRTIELSVRPLFAQRLVAQVHDACIYEVPNQEVNAAKEEIANCWGQPIDTPGGKLILPIDLKTGERWSEL